MVVTIIARRVRRRRVGLRPRTRIQFVKVAECAGSASAHNRFTRDFFAFLLSRSLRSRAHRPPVTLYPREKEDKPRQGFAHTDWTLKPSRRETELHAHAGEKFTPVRRVYNDTSAMETVIFLSFPPFFFLRFRSGRDSRLTRDGRRKNLKRDVNAAFDQRIRSDVSS